MKLKYTLYENIIRGLASFKINNYQIISIITHIKRCCTTGYLYFCSDLG